VQKYSSNAFEPKVFGFWLKKFIGIDVDNFDLRLFKKL
jgi:hypothetical protein